MELAEGLSFKDVVQHSFIMEAESITEKILGLNQIYLDLVEHGNRSEYFVQVLQFMFG